jgi:hypothetical protein
VVEDAAHTGATVSLGLTYDDVDLNDHDLLAVRLSHQDASAPAETGLDGLYGTLRLVGGELVYTVDRSLGTGSNRVDVFTVRVSDAHGGYVEQTVSFNVTSYNEPPVVGVGAGGLLNIDKAAEHVADIADIADGRLLNILPLTGAMDLNFSDMETPTELLQLSLRGAGDDFLQTDSDGIAHIPGAFGTLIFDKNDGGYMYTLNTDDLTTLRALAQSGSLGLNDSFTVRVTDEEGLSSDVTFTVHIDAEGMTAVNENSHYWSGRIDNTVLFGTDGDDRMSVTGADNFIYGGDGDDVITVSGEGNLLFGGDGNDLFIVNGSAGIHNRYDGGGGLDFLVGLTDMDSVDSLFAGGELENIDVVLVGNAGIANMNHLAGLGLQATPDGKLAIDSRWTQQDADAVPEHAVGYTAYTTSVTQANGGSETLTALVNNELLRSETGGNG